MAKWNDKTSWSVSFSLKADEKMQEFMKRMDAEHKEREEAFRERITQLFDEHIKLSGVKKDEAYNQVVTLFSIGYQCGWNDHYNLFNEKSDEDAGHRKA